MSSPRWGDAAQQAEQRIEVGFVPSFQRDVSNEAPPERCPRLLSSMVYLNGALWLSNLSGLSDSWRVERIGLDKDEVMGNWRNWKEDRFQWRRGIRYDGWRQHKLSKTNALILDWDRYQRDVLGVGCITIEEHGYSTFVRWGWFFRAWRRHIH